MDTKKSRRRKEPTWNPNKLARKATQLWTSFRSINARLIETLTHFDDAYRRSSRCHNPIRNEPLREETKSPGDNTFDRCRTRPNMTDRAQINHRWIRSNKQPESREHVIGGLSLISLGLFSFFLFLLDGVLGAPTKASKCLGHPHRLYDVDLERIPRSPSDIYWESMSKKVAVEIRKKKLLRNAETLPTFTIPFRKGTQIMNEMPTPDPLR